MRSVGGAEVRRNVLVDGNNLAHRAHYAFVEGRVRDGIPPLLSPSGAPAGVVHGFLSLLGSWLHDVPNATSASVFFDGVPRRRLAVDPGYKSGREPGGVKMTPNPETPPFVLSDGSEIRGEFELLSHVLMMLGCDVYHHPDEEADDLIASYVRSRPGEVNIVVSSDKDFFQIVGDRTVLMRPGCGGLFDEERVMAHMEKLCGARIPPAHMRMFKSLTGDPSDSIPGVPRLRKKVAATLCSHLDVDSLYASGLPGMSKAEREKAESLRARVAMNFDLVGLDSGIDLSGCRRKAARNLSGAQEALRVCLSGEAVDLSAFRFGAGPTAPLPKLDWLQDI